VTNNGRGDMESLIGSGFCTFHELVDMDVTGVR
jgi:hypothetical protein